MCLWLFVDFHGVPSQESTFRLQSESNKVPESDESDNFTMEVEEEGQGGETSTADQSSTTRMSDASESENKKIKNGQKTTKKAESGSSNGGSASKPRVRSPCPYGKDCYRYAHLYTNELLQGRKRRLKDDCEFISKPARRLLLWSLNKCTWAGENEERQILNQVQKPSVIRYWCFVLCASERH